ncbi:hypothetical protein C6501_17950 [Candidatus Poribacteria bacterium]|nr:MAG: hypothetical protein C6501_17950 [Candidatus Poribacteria bacterium]
MQSKWFLFVTIALLLNFCIFGLAQQPTILKHGSSIQSIEFSPVDVSLVASASDDHTVKIWDLQRNTATTLTGHTDKVNAVAFSPDGKLLVSGGNDRALKLWDVQLKQNIATLKHIPSGVSPSQINSVAFSPDGEMFASAGYQSVKLWDVGNRREIATLTHDDWVHAVVFSPDGQLLAAVDGKRMKIWDVRKRQIIKQLESDANWIGAIAFSPDSQIFVGAGSEGIIKFWSVSNWKVIREFKDVSSVSDLAFSPDGKSLASAGHAVVVWSVENGKRVTSFSEHTGWVMEAAFSPDGTAIASGGLKDGALYVQKITKRRKSQGKPNTVRLIYFLPSDRTPQPDIDAKLDKLIKKVQLIYASQMEHHGFGRKTFKFETDPTGKAVVHHVRGKFKDEFYQKKSGKIWDEIDKKFDTYNNIYLAALDSSIELLDGYACGFGGTRGDFGGTVLIPASGYCFDESDVTVHELGHAFGLAHDYRNNLKPWIDLYSNEPMTTSFCATQWLDVHRYFNTHETESNQLTTIQMATSTRVNETNSVRFQFKITDPDELHQAQFLIPESHESPFSKLQDFKALNGQEDTVEFVTTQLTPKTTFVQVRVMDKQGYFTEKKFPIAIDALLPPPKIVSIPDANLAAAIRKALGLSPNDSITQLDMLNLFGLNPHGNFDVSNHNITDLTGIEHAANLTSLNLSKNQIRDIRPLAKMKNLRVLKIDGNQITNVKPLTEMTNLRELSLTQNPIEDMSPIRALLEKSPNVRHDAWHLIYNVDKIVGPWLWMIAPTEPGQGGANSIDVDSLATISKGIVTEQTVAVKGVKEDDVVGHNVWRRTKISETSDNNLNELVKKIGFKLGVDPTITARDVYVKDHSAYALITLKSAIDQSNVRMFAGSDDAIKVWLNGKVVYKKAVNRGADNFQDSFKVGLKAGDNLLLVKVSQVGGKWSMFIGIDADVSMK